MKIRALIAAEIVGYLIAGACALTLALLIIFMLALLLHATFPVLPIPGTCLFLFFTSAVASWIVGVSDPNEVDDADDEVDEK